MNEAKNTLDHSIYGEFLRLFVINNKKNYLSMYKVY